MIDDKIDKYLINESKAFNHVVGKGIADEIYANMVKEVDKRVKVFSDHEDARGSYSMAIMEFIEKLVKDGLRY